MKNGALLIVVVLLGRLCLAQSLAELVEKAPPAVDEALRARVTKFYQHHVEGKFRAADELVAEDSKDIFFGADKQRCRSFVIGRISYSENFTRASVVTSCETEMMMPPVGMIPVTLPVRSLWKIVDGQWFWYMDPPSATSAVASMFGVQGSAPPPSPDAAAVSPRMGPVGPVDISSIQNAVRADRRQLAFSSNAKAVERIALVNTLPGPVGLALQSVPLPGLEATLDKKEIGQNETATLSVSIQPSAERKPGRYALIVVVSPVQQEIPIQIDIK